MKDYSDPAFPIVGACSDNQFNGMSLRDYFAGQALCGMLGDIPKSMYGLNWQENVAKGAYELADAMMEARA